MKKIIAVAAALLCSAAVFALDVSIGARGVFDIPAGTSIAGESDPTGDFSTKPFAAFGGGAFAFANFGLYSSGTGSVGIQPEIGFLYNQTRFQRESNNITYKTTTKYASFEMPVLLTYRINLGTISITPEIGPYLSIPMGKLNTSSKVTGWGSHSDSYNINSKVILGGIIGTSVGVKMNDQLDFVFDLRFMTDFQKLTTKENSRETDIQTRRGLLFGVGVQYNLSK